MSVPAKRGEKKEAEKTGPGFSFEEVEERERAEGMQCCGCREILTEGVSASWKISHWIV